MAATPSLGRSGRTECPADGTSWYRHRGVMLRRAVLVEYAVEQQMLLPRSRASTSSTRRFGMTVLCSGPHRAIGQRA